MCLRKLISTVNLKVGFFKTYKCTNCPMTAYVMWSASLLHPKKAFIKKTMNINSNSMDRTTSGMLRNEKVHQDCILPSAISLTTFRCEIPS